MKPKVPVWQMLKDAFNSIGNETTIQDVKNFILSQYGDVNVNTIYAQINVCSVNKQSRTNYPENKKPRLSNGPYDFIFNKGEGFLQKFDPSIHGIWSIDKDTDGNLIVSKSEEKVNLPPNVEDEIDKYSFALERHLRDFISRNLISIEVDHKKYQLFNDGTKDGVEFPTDVGPIDILAIDDDGNFLVFELKVEHGPDKAVGQIARYMGWIKMNLAKGKDVKGVIVAKKIDEKLKYAASIIPNVVLFEYEMSFKISNVTNQFRNA